MYAVPWLGACWYDGFFICRTELTCSAWTNEVLQKTSVLLYCILPTVYTTKRALCGWCQYVYFGTLMHDIRHLKLLHKKGPRGASAMSWIVCDTVDRISLVGNKKLVSATGRYIEGT